MKEKENTRLLMLQVALFILGIIFSLVLYIVETPFVLLGVVIALITNRFPRWARYNVSNGFGEIMEAYARQGSLG